MQRRGFIAGSGVAFASLAGCLQIGPEWRRSERTPTDDGRTDPDGPRGWRPDPDELSIGGRLHNATDEARTFDVRISDDGDTVFGVAITVAGTSTRRVPHWDAPGGTRTVTATVDGDTVVETLAFDADPTPNRTDGYVDVTYSWYETLDVGFTSAAWTDTEASATQTPI